MKQSIKKGLGFGLTSGVITTLGLIVGLHAGTSSRQIVIGGILVIAVADALSDSLGIHISEESITKRKQRDVWESTVSTFLFKLLATTTFIVPVLLLPLDLAVIIGIIWGLSLIAVFSCYIAKQRRVKCLPIVSEHLIITIIVIIATHYIGEAVKMMP